MRKYLSIGPIVLTVISLLAIRLENYLYVYDDSIENYLSRYTNECKILNENNLENVKIYACINKEKTDEILYIYEGIIVNDFYSELKLTDNQNIIDKLNILKPDQKFGMIDFDQNLSNTTLNVKYDTDYGYLEEFQIPYITNQSDYERLETFKISVSQDLFVNYHLNHDFHKTLLKIDSFLWIFIFTIVVYKLANFYVIFTNLKINTQFVNKIVKKRFYTIFTVSREQVLICKVYCIGSIKWIKFYDDQYYDLRYDFKIIFLNNTEI